VLREDVVFHDGVSPWRIHLTTEYGCGFVKRFVTAELRVKEPRSLSRAAFCSLLRVGEHLLTGL
jgi:hypothetical protein